MTDSVLPDNLLRARQRIRLAFDPELFDEAAHRWADLLSSHLEQVENSQGAVLNWNAPEQNIEEAAQIVREASRRSAELPAHDWLLDRLSELMQMTLSKGQNLHDPRYVGHQVPASIPLAGLFDALGAVTNQVMAIYEMGPWATAIERTMVQELGLQIGWKPGRFAGHITHGGTLANLTALLTARNVALGDGWERGLTGQSEPPVLVVHQESHYGIVRAAGVLGIGTNQVLRAPIDAHRKMDVERLDELLTDLRRRGVPIVAVCASACATPIGAFDPLDKIAEICWKHHVWLHVDAAHGGAALFSAKHRHLLRGLERADSVVWDAHKMMFMPALCAFVFYKNAAHRYEAFQQNAPYLFDPSAPGMAEYDSGLQTIECTKRAAALGLWGVWSMFGPQLFTDLVDVTFDLAQSLYERLRAATDFEPLHKPECNIVTFRYIPAALRTASPEELSEFLHLLRRRVIESGEFYLVQTNIDDETALRVTLINPLTTESHLDALLETLRQHGEQLLPAPSRTATVPQSGSPSEEKDPMSSEIVPESALDYDEIIKRGGGNLGDENFALCKCPQCNKVYLVEYEVDTLYLDATDLKQRMDLTHWPVEFACTGCAVPFPTESPWVGENGNQEMQVSWGDLSASPWAWITEHTRG